MATKRKMVGTFCDYERFPKNKLAPASYRWRQTPKKRGWLLFACEKGHWHERAERCDAGFTKLHLLRLKVKKGERCDKGGKRHTFSR